MLLAQPQNDTIWPIFGKFLKRLLETNILDGDSLSDQCVALFRQDWPIVSAHTIPLFINDNNSLILILLFAAIVEAFIKVPERSYRRL